MMEGVSFLTADNCFNAMLIREDAYPIDGPAGKGRTLVSKMVQAREQESRERERDGPPALEGGLLWGVLVVAGGLATGGGGGGGSMMMMSFEGVPARAGVDDIVCGCWTGLRLDVKVGRVCAAA